MNSFISATRYIALSVVLCMGIVASEAAAQNNVVVIPLGGDDLNAVWAQTNGTSGGTTPTEPGETEVNSVSIDVPMDGFLVISGVIYVSTVFASDSQTYTLIPKIDGSAITSNNWVAYTSIALGEGKTISYTITRPIAKGAHTISQTLDRQGGSPDNYYYDGEELTVMYFRSGSVDAKSP